MAKPDPMAGFPSGVSLRFVVKVDGLSLGDWTKCEGLTVEYEVEEYKEGGQNGFVHRLPGRAKYQNIKLTRPLDHASSGVAAWISRVEGPAAGHTAQIAILNSEGIPVTRRWRYLLVGAETEDDARALAQRLRDEAPPDTELIVEPNGQEVWREMHPYTVLGGLAN